MPSSVAFPSAEGLTTHPHSAYLECHDLNGLEEIITRSYRQCLGKQRRRDALTSSADGQCSLCRQSKFCLLQQSCGILESERYDRSTFRLSSILPSMCWENGTLPALLPICQATSSTCFS